MNISQILVDGCPVDSLRHEDLMNPKKLISFINADVPQPAVFMTKKDIGDGGFKRNEFFAWSGKTHKVNRKKGN